MPMPIKSSLRNRSIACCRVIITSPMLTQLPSVSDQPAQEMFSDPAAPDVRFQSEYGGAGTVPPGVDLFRALDDLLKMRLTEGIRFSGDLFYFTACDTRLARPCGKNHRKTCEREPLCSQIQAGEGARLRIDMQGRVTDHERGVVCIKHCL